MLIEHQDYFLSEVEKLQPPGVEPGPLAWKARILTVRPRLPEAAADVPKRLRGWTRNPLGSARAGSSPAVCVLCEKLSRRESNPGHPRDRRVY